MAGKDVLPTLLVSQKTEKEVKQKKRKTEYTGKLKR